ncbi:MAG: hypothetical protein PHF00_06145 [Elusimicrobia bacterium]|nr:hypothetical protein [Elusimicrobiota bacterium]
MTAARKLAFVAAASALGAAAGIFVGALAVAPSMRPAGPKRRGPAGRRRHGWRAAA